MTTRRDTGLDGAAVSRWRAQLGALGLDAAAAEAPEARAEARRIAALRLPALPQLPAPQRARPVPLWRRPAAAVIGVAAALLAVIVLMPREDDSPLRIKGAGSVRVWWERAGAVKPLGEGGPLTDGDRVLAEVDAGADGVAYWLVTDGAGKPLVDERFVAGSALPLKAGARTSFAGGLRIVGDPVGETLVVFVCAGAGLDAEALVGLARGITPDRCRESRHKLR